MRKYVIGFTVAIVLLMLCACSNKTENAPDLSAPVRLEGYYISNFIDGAKYKFEITNLASGDYGGEITNMEDTNVICAYYVVGNEVFVDGKLTYYYVDGYLACVQDATTLTIGNGNKITGKYKKTVIPSDHNPSYGREYEFAGDGTIVETHYYASHPTRSWISTYTTEENIITVSSEGSTDKLFILHNKVIYPILERI